MAREAFPRGQRACVRASCYSLLEIPKAARMWLLLLIAWSMLCISLGMLAGCWCTCRSRSHAPGPRGRAAVAAEESDGDEADADADTKTKKTTRPTVQAPSPPRTQWVTVRKSRRLYHTDADDTRLHARSDCRGLQGASRRLLSRETCKLCCNSGVDIIPS